MGAAAGEGGGRFGEGAREFGPGELGPLVPCQVEKEAGILRWVLARRPGDTYLRLGEPLAPGDSAQPGNSTVIACQSLAALLKRRGRRGAKGRRQKGEGWDAEGTQQPPDHGTVISQQQTGGRGGRG